MTVYDAWWQRLTAWQFNGTCSGCASPKAKRACMHTPNAQGQGAACHAMPCHQRHAMPCHARTCGQSGWPASPPGSARLPPRRPGGWARPGMKGAPCPAAASSPLVWGRRCRGRGRASAHASARSCKKRRKLSGQAHTLHAWSNHVVARPRTTQYSTWQVWARHHAASYTRLDHALAPHGVGVRSRIHQHDLLQERHVGGVD